MPKFLVGEAMEAYGRRREREMRGDQDELKLLIPFGFGNARGSQFLPNNLPDLAAWFSYGNGITSAGGLVSRWADRSGNGRDRGDIRWG